MTIIWACLIALVIITGYVEDYFNKPKRISFQQHKKITTGRIVDHDYTGYRTFASVVYYQFFAKGKMYNETGDAPPRWEKFIGKQFPVIYDSLNPNYNYLLIFPKDFQEFGISFPDSLDWDIRYQNQ